MDVLAAAPTVGERRAVFDALKHMTEGTDQLVHMLEHSQWFVVRNVAELIGELGMDDAVPALGKCLDHEDERVRKAVGLALAKIGTRGAAEPLRRALRDRSQEVRMQVPARCARRPAAASRSSSGRRAASPRRSPQAGMKLILGSSRRANAASSRAARSRSSRATISFGLCMYRLGTLTSPVGIPRSAL